MAIVFLVALAIGKAGAHPQQLPSLWARLQRGIIDLFGWLGVEKVPFSSISL